MKKDDKEVKVIIQGGIDLTKTPKDALDVFLIALKEDFYRWLKEKKEKAE